MWFFFIFSILFFLVPFFIMSNPIRTAKYRENNIYSPCDGTVIKKKQIKPDSRIYSTNEVVWCITIENGFFNTYIRKYPVKGIIEKHYSFSAPKEKYALRSIDCIVKNTMYITSIVNKNQHTIACVDNIDELSWLSIIWNGPLHFTTVGDEINIGESYGIIPFGSTIDIYFPCHYEPQVEVGQTVIAAETIIASIPLRVLPSSTSTHAGSLMVPQS